MDYAAVWKQCLYIADNDLKCFIGIPMGLPHHAIFILITEMAVFHRYT